MAGLRRHERPRMFFSIRPDGRVRIPRRHAHAADEVTEALRSADGRLKPFEPQPADAPSPPSRDAGSPDQHR
jgi:hypothetical protein